MLGRFQVRLLLYQILNLRHSLSHLQGNHLLLRDVNYDLVCSDGRLRSGNSVLLVNLDYLDFFKNQTLILIVGGKLFKFLPVLRRNLRSRFLHPVNLGSQYFELGFYLRGDFL